MHTAALAATFQGHLGRLAAGTRVLFVAAGAGVTAGAALYRQRPGPA
jgi:3-oxoacyl-[acyl-carrier-protein] synthase-3